MQHGQRVETYLPAGEWKCDGECLITTGRDSAEHVPAVILFRTDKPEGVWYISPGIITNRMDAISRALSELAVMPHGPSNRSQVYQCATDLWFNRSYASAAFSGTKAHREFGEAVADEWAARHESQA